MSKDIGFCSITEGICRKEGECKTCSLQHIYTNIEHYAKLHEQGRLIVTPETGIGDLSDGYHTFNELYHHRAVLFSVICNAFKSCAWKSKKHSDGTMYDGMFIVGIDTPEGSATYHYDIEPYWNMFDVKELDKAPEWDGHTPDDAINRIAKLKENESNRCVYCQDGKSLHGQKIIPTNYGWQAIKYCPNCGAKMELKELEG